MLKMIIHIELFTNFTCASRRVLMFDFFLEFIKIFRFSNSFELSSTADPF